jgi:excisionase family DNA binding protein
VQAYTVEQVAEMLHIGRDKVYGLLRTGQLRSMKIGKLRRITDRHLAEFVASLETPPNGRDRKRHAAERLQAGEKWQDHDLVFCREDGAPLDRWQVRREFAVITRAAGLGEEWAPRELRHSFVSILSASGVRIEDISDLMGHSGTSVTETVYRHEIRPALTTGATAMSKILSKKRTRFA